MSGASRPPSARPTAAHPTAADPTAQRPATLPSGLRLDRVVGRGATSTVWAGRDRRVGRDVAVKVLPLSVDGPDRARLTERFDHELRALARLAGEPNVLGVVAAGVEPDCCWIVTDLADGSLADSSLAGDGPLPVERLLSSASDAAAGLAAAHRMDVVHGDVTPANVLWMGDRAVVADFGMSALQLGPDPSGTAALGATPGWAAPERLEGGAPTPASDVYGWGATVWSAATGERPNRHAPPDGRRAPRHIGVVLDAACHPDPDRRPAMDELLEAVARERRRRDRYIPGP